MSKIIVTQFMSLDGVLEAPEKWSFPYWNDRIADFKQNELFSVDALLLGRVTYEGFAAAWPGRTDETGYADRINNLPKYVVSTTLKKADWKNSTIMKGSLAEEISALKKKQSGNILIFGSPTLVQSLADLNLIDEYRLLVYPIVLGSGKRLFSNSNKAMLTLTESKTYDSGVVLLTYGIDKK